MRKRGPVVSAGGATISVGAAFARWAIPASAAGLAISMAPLMLVFVAKESTGDFAMGSLIVGAFVVGELVGASTIGVLSRASSIRGRLAWGYIVSAMAFLGIAFAMSIPFVLVLPLAFIAGFAPSPSPGTLQAVLLDLVPEALVPRALVAARVQSTIVFMAGPALVGILSFGVPVWVSPIVCSASMVLALVGLAAIPNANVSSAVRSPALRTLRLVWSVWPIYAVGFAATFVVGLVDLVVAPLLVQRDVPAGWVGPIAALFFGAGLAGSLLYGLRKTWPGSYSTQSFLVTCFMVGGICLAAIIPTASGIAAGVLIAGSGVAILLMIRTLSLREILPKEMHASAFSLNYAMSCLSYILCAAIGGTSLATGAPSNALLIGALTILAVGVIACIFESVLARRRVQASRELI